MAKYRNQRKDLEDLETQELENQENLLKEPAANVEEETWKKRYADNQRYLSQIKADAKQREVELERKLDQALRGQLKAPKSDEDVENWMKEYPEFAGILETIVQKRIKEATSSTTEKLNEISDRQRKLDAEEARMALKKLHPDLDTLAQDKVFHEWLSKQKPRYQDAIYRSLDLDDADLVITKYKAEVLGGNKSKVDEFSNRDVAKVVRTPKVSEPVDDYGDYEYTESGIEKASKGNRKWYEQNEPKILDAMRRGKVLFDVSGGAR